MHVISALPGELIHLPPGHLWILSLDFKSVNQRLVIKRPLISRWIQEAGLSFSKKSCGSFARLLETPHAASWQSPRVCTFVVRALAVLWRAVLMFSPHRDISEG